MFLVYRLIDFAALPQHSGVAVGKILTSIC